MFQALRSRRPSSREQSSRSSRAATSSLSKQPIEARLRSLPPDITATNSCSLICAGLSLEPERQPPSVSPFSSAWTSRWVKLQNLQVQNLFGDPALLQNVFQPAAPVSSSLPRVVLFFLQVRETQALILAPTRELAGQIQKVALHPPPSHRDHVGVWF